jgi:hypothetical protein
VGFKKEMAKFFQSALKINKREYKTFHQRQAERFRPMKDLLPRMLASMDAKFIKVSVSDVEASVKIGTLATNSSDFETHMQWDVSPNYEIRSDGQPDGRIFYEVDLPGVRIEEINRLRGLEDEESEDHIIFETGREALRYLVDKISGKISLYRQLEATQQPSGKL